MSYLSVDTMAELRREFPRTRIAEFVDQVANPFFKSCFASMSHFAREIGVCDRTAFRYSKRLKQLGLFERVPGSRYPETMPAGSTQSGQVKLRAHGYALSRLRGWLAQMVAQGLSQVAEYTRRTNERKQREWERRRTRESNERREATAAFVASLQTPAGVAPPLPTERRPYKAPQHPPAHAWGDRDAAHYAELVRELQAEPTGPPE